ncbi:helix-turn-helix domain-containing protein [Streptomyces sp. NPDC059247]|uniref:helix-turn-helix domain-containing protein n=1 Tax=Streptomyces sp. NPDC059247 TaxID=3346790 RepID=UPI0036AFE897
MRRHTCARGDCELILTRPDPRLRPGVVGYCSYRLTGDGPRQRIFAPGGAVSLFLGLDGEMSAGHTGPDAPVSLRRAAALYGPHLHPKLLGHRGTAEGVEISVLPWVARLLFDAPLGDLADAVVEADAVLGRCLPSLAEDLRTAPGPRARFDVLDRHLLRWTASADAARAPSPTVLHAWDLITRSAGTLTVRDVAARTRWSSRLLELRFREQIGLSPKRLARALRMERAIGLLATGRSQTDTAHTAGFSDQPHLSREFRTLTGLPPGRFLDHLAPGCAWPTVAQDSTSSFAFVQDPAGAPRQDSDHDGTPHPANAHQHQHQHQHSYPYPYPYVSIERNPR